MASFSKIVGLASASILFLSFSTEAQQTYSGNGSTGFGGQIGTSTLTVSDSPTGAITFSFPSTGINDVAFYFSTGVLGVSSTSPIASISANSATEPLRTVSGDGTSLGPSVANFAAGFSADYAVAIDGSANDASLYSISTSGVLTLVATGVTETATGSGYSFTLNSTSIGLTADSGASFKFVATLGNADDTSNATDSNYYRSNEAFGADNLAANAGGNPGNTGSITFTGSDTYTLAVPEPATWLMMLGGLAGLVGIQFRRRRI